MTLPCKSWFVRWTEEPEVVAAIRTALDHCRSVTSVTPGGSRERDSATELSDWDLYLEGDPEAMTVQVPEVIASFRPLTAFWEPLAEEAGYMVVIDGPIKVDVFPTGIVKISGPPGRVRFDYRVAPPPRQ
jgi:hypothetical protein